MKDRSYLLLFALVWVGLAILMGFYAIEFYQMYSLPFGRIDVDNYLATTYMWITGEKYNWSHMLFMIMGYIGHQFGVKPEILFSIVMPIVISAIPFVAFLFYLYSTRKAKVAFVSFVFMVFGTFTMLSFWIMSFWGQAVATASIMLALIFYDIASKGNRKYYAVFAVMVILAFLAHYASPLMLLILLLLKLVDDRRFSAVLMVGVLLSVLGLIVFMAKDNLLADSYYPFSVDLVYILGNGALPLLWLLSIFGMYVSRGDKNLKILSWFTVLGFVMSSQFVLWRPITTVLCFVAMFAGIGFVRLLDRMSRVGAVVVSILMIVLLLNYILVQYNGFMGMMLWEMTNNVKDMTRNLDPHPLINMFFGGGDVKVTGYTTPFSNSTHETVSLIKNGTEIPIISGVY